MIAFLIIVGIPVAVLIMAGLWDIFINNENTWND